MNDDDISSGDTRPTQIELPNGPEWMDEYDANDGLKPAYIVDINTAKRHKSAYKDTDIDVPPHDIQAEQAVLSGMLLDPSSLSLVAGRLQPRHFYSDAHATMYKALLELSEAGKAPDILLLRSHLNDRRILERCGGAPYLVEILDAIPAISNIKQYTDRIIEKSVIRDIIASARRIAATGYSENDGAKLLADARKTFESIQASRHSRFETVASEQIFEPLRPIRWVCRDLCIGPGRPTLIAGYGFSGKTIACQDLALSVASGNRVWGHYFCKPGRVLHIDYEQGKHATFRRYQRLAFARSIDEQQIDNRLSVSCFPRFYLSEHGAEDVLAEECQGVDLCVIDSLKAATMGVEENSSEIREYLDIMTRVSERTGTSFVVVHHAGKGGQDRDRRESIRGSSAIFDACGTVLKLSTKEPYAPVHVEIAKVSASASGKRPDSFYIAFEDIADDDGNDMQAGLKLIYKTNEQVDPPTSGKQRVDAAMQKVQQIVKNVPGISTRAILEQSGMRKSTTYAALDELERLGRIIRDNVARRGGGFGWTLASDTEGEDE